ncbi:MAG TPA: alpha/beta hydrolase [Euzebyales bacterium]
MAEASTAPVYLVARTTDETVALPERCAAWAARTGAAVDVVGPVAGADLRRLLQRDRYAGAAIEIAPVRDDDTLAAAVARAPFPVVAVTRGAPSGAPDAADAACAAAFAGRGTGGFLWALWHLHALHTHPPRTVAYGDDPAHLGDLRLPAGDAPAAAVVLVHGGFWRHEWGRDLMDGLAVDLPARGYATWNVEYRRVGPTGGGWPHSADDVVRAVTALPMLAGDRVDPARVVLLGHSAGAQLALRAAAHLRDRGLTPALVLAAAGLLDLDAAARAGVGWGSVEAFLGGGPDEVAAAYGAAAPIAHLPLGVPQVLVHGDADAHVPFDQSAAYRDRASAAGDAVELVPLPGADHFAVLDPTSGAWATTVAALALRSPPRAGLDDDRGAHGDREPPPPAR